MALGNVGGFAVAYGTRPIRDAYFSPYGGTDWGCALARLWGAAASKVKVRHPIMDVYATFHVGAEGGSALIRLNCANLPDNDNPSHRMGFGMRTFTREWPGYRVAGLFLLASYTILQAHDAMEQVEYLETGKRILCPHYGQWSEHHKKHLDAIAYGHVVDAIGFLVGPAEAQTLVQQDAERAKKELETEIEWGGWTE